MKFFKENSYDIVRLFVNQIGITIFAMMLYTAAGMALDESLVLSIKILVSVFSILFYLTLLYTCAWDYGAKDRIRVDGGRMTYRKGKGALLALYANVPNLLLSLVLVILSFIALLTGAEGMLQNSAFSVINLILRLLSSMFIGVFQGIFVAFKEQTTLYWFLQSVCFLFAPVFSVAATHIGYTMGMKQLRIASLFGKSSDHKPKA